MVNTTMEPLSFYLNDVFIELENHELPRTVEHLKDLANSLLGVENQDHPSGISQAVAYISAPSKPQKIFFLTDSEKIASFWTKARSSKMDIKIRISTGQKAASGDDNFYSALMKVLDQQRPEFKALSILLILVGTLFFPTLKHMLPKELQPLVRNGLANIRSECEPKEQMTNYAMAMVEDSDLQSGHSFLQTLQMQEANTYFKAVAFQTSRDNKREATKISLSTTNLPAEIMEKIATLVDNTDSVVEQIADFSYTSDGKAVSYSVNLWISTDQPNNKVDVALMVSGASFKRSAVEAVQEVDEPQYKWDITYHPATYFSSAFYTKTQVPVIVNGQHQCRKVKLPVFQDNRVKPHEFDMLRKYLTQMVSKEALANFAPTKLAHVLPATALRRPQFLNDNVPE